jgi:hypothetical protein
MHHLGNYLEILMFYKRKDIHSVSQVTPILPPLDTMHYLQYIHYKDIYKLDIFVYM